MHSPFPGMDPYLEGELWSTFHAQFAIEIAHALNPSLAPRYVAFPEKYQNTVGAQEIGITFDREARIPDVAVSRSGKNSRHAGGAAGAGTALARPLQLDTVVTIPVNHVWIKILDLKQRLLVTAIEFLSPANKRGPSRRKYLRRRNSFLLSQTHFMEIDLLRTGHRVPMVGPLPEAAYFVFLSRAKHRPATQVWPIGLDACLPTVPIPLLAPDKDAELELQQVFNRVYDLGSFGHAIDYRDEPDVRLPPDWASWADRLLRAAGKRPRGRRK